MASSNNEFDELAIAQIAANAQVDPRSVRKFLRGERVRGLAGARIARAVAQQSNAGGQAAHDNA